MREIKWLEWDLDHCIEEYFRQLADNERRPNEEDWAQFRAKMTVEARSSGLNPIQAHAMLLMKMMDACDRINARKGLMPNSWSIQ